jgi:transketolase
MVNSLAMTEQKSTREGFGDGLLEIAESHPEVVTIDADLRHSVQTLKFATKYPARAFQVGIAEQNLIGVGAGLARAGKLPFVASFAVFSTGLAYNQIRQSVCYSELPVIVVGSHAGVLTGEDGATHQALEDIGLMRGLPHMQVYSPADYYEAKAMVRLLAEQRKPAYLRLGRQKTPVVYDAKHKFKLGKADILRAGKNIVIFATGHEVGYALEALAILKAKKINPTLVNVSTIKPLDLKTILAVSKSAKQIFTIEDHSIIGGMGSSIAEVIAEHQIKAKLTRLGMRDQFGESGKTEELLRKYKLDTKGIAGQVLKYMV